jgi:acyl carrier protein
MNGIEVATTVAAEWQRILNTVDTDPNADFFELGGDSLGAADLMTAVEERLGITFPIETLFMDGTLGALVEACNAVAAQRGCGTS